MRALIFLFTLAVAAPAAAQTAVATYGDWTVKCTAIGVDRTDCGINQRVTTQNGALLADVTISRTVVQGQERGLLVALTPQGVSLSAQAVYQVDGDGPQVGLSWRTCANEVCRAATLIDAPQEAALRAGNRMVLAYRRLGAAEGVGVPVSLRGVTAGLNALAAR